MFYTASVDQIKLCACFMVHVDDIKQCFDPFEKLHILCLWQPMLAGQKDTEIYYKVV